jgi:ubiquinone biosynthesis protein COQ4
MSSIPSDIAVTAFDTSGHIPRRDWPRAFRALSRLLKNKEDTAMVFEIMAALNGGATFRGYMRLISNAEGGRLAFGRQELADTLSDHAALARLPEGSLGRVYLDFVRAENISAQGLVEESRKAKQNPIDLAHPLAWYGRRLRDIHDLWHVLSGYGRDALGEACLVSFSYAQTKSMGFGLIGAAGAYRISRAVPGHKVKRAALQAYLNGRRAAWLPGQDYVQLLGQPLEAVRQALNIAPPSLYLAVPFELRNGIASDLTAKPAVQLAAE